MLTDSQEEKDEESHTDEKDSMDGLDMPDPEAEEADFPEENQGFEEEKEGSSGLNIKDMLMRTEPATPLDEVESIWDTEKGGVTRITRGLQKMADTDGLPAVIDVVIGVLEFYSSMENKESQEADETEYLDEL